MNSQNINTNVAQIILPPDMELRKIKKKPKKSLEKKKALKELKDTLKEYDSVVAIAADRNVDLPAEIGVLPTNIADINTIKELKAFTATLKSRIAIINQLITESMQKTKRSGIFGEGDRMRLPALPARPAIPIPIQPSVIQPSIPQNPAVINPRTGESDAGKSLDQLEKELMAKLTPEESAKYKEKFKDITPASRQQGQIAGQGQAQKGMRGTLFQKDIGYDIGGGKRINIISPIGWTNIYTPYRMYIEDIQFKLQKVDKGVFVLPPEAEQILNSQRQGILAKYDTWLQGLNPEQLKALDADKTLAQLNKDMLRVLELDPKDVIKMIAKKSSIPIKEITDGKTTIEKEAKKEGLSTKATQFLQLLKQNKTYIDGVVSTIATIKRNDEIPTTITELEEQQKKIDRAFAELGADRATILSDYNEFKLNLRNILSSLEAYRLAPEGSVIIDPITYRHTEQMIRPADPDVPVVPVVQPIDPGTGVPEPLPPERKPPNAGTRIKGGRFLRDRIEVGKNTRVALGKLLTFSAEDVATRFTQQVQEALNTVRSDPQVNILLDTNMIERGIANLPGKPPTARNNAARVLVKTEVIDKVLLPISDAD